MIKLNRLTVSNSEYERMIEIQLYNRNKFKEHLIGSRKKLIVFEKPIATIRPSMSLDIGLLKNSQFAIFLANFNRQLYQQFFLNQDLLSLDIPFSGMSRRKNKDAWFNLKEKELFYNIDLNSAYWQVAYRLGYIKESFYHRYLNRYSHKKAKRYCISFLVRKNEMIYHNGKHIYHIGCDITVFKQIYKNIRHELYNIIKGCLSLVGEDYIEYNIDGISVGKQHLQTIKEYFDSLGLDFKVSLCIKKNKTEYIMGPKTRVFTRFSEDWDKIYEKTPQNEPKTDVYIGEKTPPNKKKTRSTDAQ
jgi:hypothetical protein